MFNTTVTQKGQVTIPVYIRKMVNLKPRQKVTVSVEGDTVTIKPAIDFFSLRGSLKTNKPFNIKAMTQSAQNYVAKGYADKIKKGY